MFQSCFLFWLRTNQLNSKGEAKIYCRIQSDYKRINFSTGSSVKPNHWNQELKRVSELNPRQKIINETLDRIEQRLRRILYKLEDDGLPISPEIIKNEYDGKSKSKKSLFDIFLYYINQHQTRSSKRTLTNYFYTEQRIRQYLLRHACLQLQL